MSKFNIIVRAKSTGADGTLVQGYLWDSPQESTLDEVVEVRTKMLAHIGQGSMKYLIIHTAVHDEDIQLRAANELIYDEIVLGQKVLESMVVVMTIVTVGDGA